MVESLPPLGPVVRFGVFELDVRTGELRKSGLRVGLQDQPLQVLTMLLERRGALVTREELRQRLWPADTFVDFEQGLNAAVKRLRTALGDSADVPRFIETLPRRGYRWITAADPSSRPTADAGDSGAGPDAAPQPVQAPARPFAARWLLLAAAVLALGGLAFTWRKLTRPAVGSAPGHRVRLLTKLAGSDQAFTPALSPDGTRVAFCWTEAGKRGLHVKDIASGRQVRVGEGLAGVFSPTWSPDGREIAFLRHGKGGDRHDEIVVVPAEGGPERALGTARSSNHGLDWSPDGRLLAFVDKVAADAPDAIHLLTIETGERRRLTTPVGTASDAGDHEPSFSPDGRSVAFIRRGSDSPTATDLYVHDVGSSDSRPVTSGYGVRDVAWTPDGRSLVFEGGRPQQGTLWIVGVEGGTARPLHGDGGVGIASVGRGNGRLWYEERVVDANVWRANGPAPVGQEPPRKLSREPRQETQPAYSADGRRVAFGSTRKAGLGIRMCAADGTDCVDFESASYLARPQWSPDGRSLAAVGWQGDEPLDVYRLEVEGRFVKRLTTDNAVDSMPTWSRDGRWLYFASDRSGTYEIWKMPSGGGEARQVTRGGGLYALEAADGTSLYFTKGETGSVWRMPAEGGVATLVLDQRIHFSKWTLWRDHIVYVDEPATGTHRLMAFEPTTRRSTLLQTLDKPSGSGVSVSPDGAWVLYVQRDGITSDIVLLEGYE